jgi:hypothetical protein
VFICNGVETNENGARSLGSGNILAKSHRLFDFALRKQGLNFIEVDFPHALLHSK